jgi:TatD DNase family protein
LFTDTHCHLDLMEANVADVVERSRAAGVTTLVTVATDLASSAQSIGAASTYAGVYATVGIHPHNAIEATDHVLKLLAGLACHPKVVAIGETGLDWFRDHSPRIRQEESFREHIRLAKEFDKALVVHDRDAHDDVVAVLDDERAPERTIFHCFSGNADLVNLCAERGWFMSFAGNVTFKNAPGLRQAAAAAPRELLLAETDSPYLSPHPYRGKPNEPARVLLTVAQLAKLHGTSMAAMGRTTTENALRAFALPA